MFQRFSVLICASIFLSACGGSGGGDGSPANTSSVQITGTAATGAALANANVSITNSGGTSPCVEATITTTSVGSYTCNLKSGQTAPFFIVVTDPSGIVSPLVSIATSTPAAGTSLTVNATPLTTAIVAQLNNGDALGVVTNKALYIPADFATIKANVTAQIQSVLTAIGAPANYDPFSTSITAAASSQVGNTADLVLDVVKVVTDSNGMPALSTISNPTPITMAGKNTTTVVSLPAPSANVSSLPQGLQLMAQSFTNCFALPLTQRVLATTSPVPNGNQGGPEVSSTTAPCNALVTDGTIPSVLPKYKHNGYSAGQQFYGLLTVDSMTGAQFSVPEVVLFAPGVSGATDITQFDRVVLNMRFLDAMGNPGNKVSIAARAPGSGTASHPSDWWLVGNQQSVDIGITTIIRRQQQFGPNSSNVGMGSRFKTGLNFAINAYGPNGANYDAVRIKGNGLPDSGIWYYLTGPQTGFGQANERNTSASDTTVPMTFTNCGFCVNFWMAKTSSLTNLTRIANSPTSSNEAQGTGLPAYATGRTGFSPENSYNGVTGTRPAKGDIYTFELFKLGTPYITVTKRLTNEVIDAANGANMAWNNLGPQSIAGLDPTNVTLNGQQTSMTLDWVQNPAAEQISKVWVSMLNGDDGSTTVPAKGATSFVAYPTSAGIKYTGLTGALSYFVNGVSDNGYREYYFVYRMSDGSQKWAGYSYAP